MKFKEMSKEELKEVIEDVKRELVEREEFGSLGRTIKQFGYAYPVLAMEFVEGGTLYIKFKDLGTRGYFVETFTLDDVLEDKETCFSSLAELEDTYSSLESVNDYSIKLLTEFGFVREIVEKSEGKK